MPQPGILDSSLALVGPGRAGRAFARSWLTAGGHIAHVIVRDIRSSKTTIGGAAVVAVSASRLPAADILVLAVPDDAIEPVAANLAGRLACRYGFHLSGALASGALAALRRHGAAIASLHPVRPFIGAENEDWRGAFVAVEGDADALLEGERIATAVGARPYRLSAAHKPLYHASASLAAGGAAAILSVAVRGWVAAGIPEDIARETLAGLASRATAAVGERSFAAALTGAVARRDLGTIRAHVEALRSHGPALDLYRALGEEILERTAGRGREQEVRELLGVGRAPVARTTASS